MLFMRPHRAYRAIAPAMCLSVLACGAVGPSHAAEPAAPSAESEKHRERPVLKELWPVLRNKAARIYYEAICPADENYPLAFPRVEVRPPSDKATDLAAVRSMFREQHAVSVAEDAPGIIRIRIGEAPHAILGTRIPTLTLKPIEQYNP